MSTPANKCSLCGKFTSYDLVLSKRVKRQNKAGDLMPSRKTVEHMYLCSACVAGVQDYIKALKGE